MKTVFVLACLLLASAPIATADDYESTCVGAACVNRESFDEGGTGCGNGDEEYFGYRGISATVDDGTTTTGAYFYEYCYEYNGDEWENGSARSWSIAVTQLPHQEGVIVYWEGGSFEESGDYCGIMVHAHAAGTGIFDFFPCATPPPSVLFGLP